jgi:hypothetical protein
MGEAQVLTADPEASTSPPRSGRSRRRFVVLAIVILVVAALVWGLSARAVVTSIGITSAGPFTVGEPEHVGETGMVLQDITVLWVRPHIRGPAEVTFNVCRRDGDPGKGAIGTLSGADALEANCARLEPLRSGTVLTGPPNDLDYVVATLTPTGNDEPIVYCGMDLVYRAGLRFGVARMAGVMQSVLYPRGQKPFVDDQGRPSDFPEPEDDPC